MSILLLTVWGCDSLTTYTDVHDFASGEWKKAERVRFDFTPTSSLEPSHIILSVRYAPELVGSRFVMSTALSSAGMTHRDSVLVTLPRGSGAQVRTLELLWRDGIEWAGMQPYSMEVHTSKDMEGVLGLSVEILGAVGHEPSAAE